MHNGTIKWIDNNHNCGFIIPDDDNNQNIFIHVSQLKKLGINKPKNGQRVAFSLLMEKHSFLNNISIIN